MRLPCQSPANGVDFTPLAAYPSARIRMSVAGCCSGHSGGREDLTLMRRLGFSILLAASVALSGCATGRRAPAEGAGDGAATVPGLDSDLRAFALGVGDRVSVRVWRNQDLDRVVQVDPAGAISLPLVGDIACAGLSIPQLRQEITTRLSAVLLAPQVDVSLEEMKSRTVHILGEVRSPGTVTLDRPLSPWSAVARAGGFTADADAGKVLLVRIEGREARVSAFSLESLIGGGGPVTAACLREGDIVYVPPSRIASVERFMNRFNAIILPLVTLERSIILGDEVVDILGARRGGHRNIVIGQ